ncbi:MAG: hypothetical protein J0651_03025 [Actinobacteria bacterium]|nr:hypothetical protein [Actinomycetota bacterium]
MHFIFCFLSAALYYALLLHFFFFIPATVFVLRLGDSCDNSTTQTFPAIIIFIPAGLLASRHWFLQGLMHFVFCFLSAAPCYALLLQSLHCLGIAFLLCVSQGSSSSFVLDADIRL